MKKFIIIILLLQCATGYCAENSILATDIDVLGTLNSVISIQADFNQAMSDAYSDNGDSQDGITFMQPVIAEIDGSSEYWAVQYTSGSTLKLFLYPKVAGELPKGGGWPADDPRWIGSHITMPSIDLSSGEFLLGLIIAGLSSLWIWRKMTKTVNAS